MGNNNSNGEGKNTYDAIVIGSGISGGWAAKELCEKGLKTLVLERGRDVKHLVDYPTMSKNPWDFRTATTLPFNKRRKTLLLPNVMLLERMRCIFL
jgi:choline dehydrogenase-like flavoprotein